MTVSHSNSVTYMASYQYSLEHVFWLTFHPPPFKKFVTIYIVSNIGRELKLAVWQPTLVTTKVDTTNISDLHTYIW